MDDFKKDMFSYAFKQKRKSQKETQGAQGVRWSVIIRHVGRMLEA